MNVIERQTITDSEVKVLLSALTALKKGDSAVRLPLEWTGVPGKLAEMFNEVVELNDGLTQELTRRFAGRDRAGQLPPVQGNPGRRSAQERVSCHPVARIAQSARTDAKRDSCIASFRPMVTRRAGTSRNVRAATGPRHASCR